MTFPKITNYHQIENSQGTLDPIGLYAIADRLGAKLAPDLRERMRHPRYMTAIAVGKVICSDIGEDYASDGVSTAWQVYEWYVVSALVKVYTKTDPDQLIGLPGREKTNKAIKENIGLNKDRYLKTASVFGFHGVFKTLTHSYNFGLCKNNYELNTFGENLVDTWAEEQGLSDFRTNPENKFRKELSKSVRGSMLSGSVSDGWNAKIFEDLGKFLKPKVFGAKESELVKNQLKKCDYKSEFIDFISEYLNSNKEIPNEFELHQQYLKVARINKETIEAIQAYEAFARLLFNAFYSIVQGSSTSFSLDTMCNNNYVLTAFKEIQSKFKYASQKIESLDSSLGIDFIKQFENLTECASINLFAKTFIDHHKKVQSSKVPKKASWILEGEGNMLIIYGVPLQEKVLAETDYVHNYRRNTLVQFLMDLKTIN
jgi:hypothetical protein